MTRQTPSYLVVICFLLVLQNCSQNGVVYQHIQNIWWDIHASIFTEQNKIMKDSKFHYCNLLQKISFLFFFVSSTFCVHIFLISVNYNRFIPQPNIRNYIQLMEHLLSKFPQKMVSVDSQPCSPLTYNKYKMCNLLIQVYRCLRFKALGTRY